MSKASPEGRRQVVRRLRPEDAKAFNIIGMGSSNDEINVNEGSSVEVEMPSGSGGPSS